MAWKAYLQTVVTEESIAQHFDQHRERFDGTTVELAQIFWKVDRSDPATVSATQRSATQVREQLISKELAFADAAAEHSQSVSGKAGWPNWSRSLRWRRAK